MANLQEQTKQAIEKLNQELLADGSRVELLSVDGDVVRVKLWGFLCDCPSSLISFHQEVEGFLRENVVGVRKVISL